MTQRVLVIDDEAHLRMMVRVALESAGYEVGEAADGEQGLHLFGDGAGWDLVLLDQRMPGMDGLQTLGRIRERKKTTRVVMVTAYASIELAVDAMKLGATDFLRKPMTPETLRRGVAAALERQESDTLSAAPPGEAPPLFPVETVTMNGFHIVRPADAGSRGEGRGERRFIVRTPGGMEQEVLVTIAPPVMLEIERHSRRSFPPDSTFWTDRAESRLAGILWETGQVPTRRITIETATPDDFGLAARWGIER